VSQNQQDTHRNSLERALSIGAAITSPRQTPSRSQGNRQTKPKHSLRMPASDTAQTKLVVLSGPSGSGKTTIVNRLIAESPVPLRKSVSATTRPPRPGEIHGQDYYFLKREEFETKLRQQEFLEHAEVFSSGFLYGTLRSELQQAELAGAWALLEIDVQGAMKVMREYPGAVTIFLSTPSEEVFEQRLRDRGTESEETIRKRLATAREELQFADRYRYIVNNDSLDQAVREICDILSTEMRNQDA
jgi:guanylate kinase